MQDAVKASGAGVVTVSLRREQARGRTGERFMDMIKSLGVAVLPNTAGCRTAKEAITRPRWRVSCSAPPGSRWK